MYNQWLTLEGDGKEPCVSSPFPSCFTRDSPDSTLVPVIGLCNYVDHNDSVCVCVSLFYLFFF